MLSPGEGRWERCSMASSSCMCVQPSSHSGSNMHACAHWQQVWPRMHAARPAPTLHAQFPARRDASRTAWRSTAALSMAASDLSDAERRHTLTKVQDGGMAGTQHDSPLRPAMMLFTTGPAFGMAKRYWSAVCECRLRRPRLSSSETCASVTLSVGLPAPAHSVDTPQGFEQFLQHPWPVHAMHGRGSGSIHVRWITWRLCPVATSGSAWLMLMSVHRGSTLSVYHFNTCIVPATVPFSCRQAQDGVIKRPFVHASAYHAQKSEAECLTQFC